jgi:transposase-like protein
MSPLPRVARVPLTSKQPDACPHCGSRNLTRRGTRKKKLEIVQLWRCASCKRVFTPGPAALHNKTYPLRMILSALTDYDTGYTLQETAARLKKKTIRSIKLYHRQIYGYAYHRPKLELVREGRLDDKRTGDNRFAQLATFLESIPTSCPHELFTRDDDPKARASQATPGWADASRIIVNSKRNAATDTAALIIPAVGNNKLRHETLQHFMLANDSVTIAVEIPIWLTEPDIAALEREHDIELVPRTGTDRAITGHIDFLQVRNGCVHVLDYKPDARTNRPIAQLAIYALALTRRVPGLKLFDIKCAWFNELEYLEIFPRTLFSRR